MHSIREAQNSRTAAFPGRQSLQAHTDPDGHRQLSATDLRPIPVASQRVTQLIVNTSQSTKATHQVYPSRRQ